MNPDWKDRLQKLADTQAASGKSVVVSEEKCHAIIHHLLNPDEKIDPHFKHWIKHREFQVTDMPGLGLKQVLTIPNTDEKVSKNVGAPGERLKNKIKQPLLLV